MIFIGGPLHGQDIDPRKGSDGPPPSQVDIHVPKDMPITAASIMDGSPLMAEDVSTLHTYARIMPKFADQADHGRTYTQVAYIHPTIAARPVLDRQVALADALATWWFRQGDADAPALSNGHGGTPGELVDLAPVVQHHAVCDCGDTKAAISLLERAQWMQQHIELGHKPEVYTPSNVDAEKE